MDLRLALYDLAAQHKLDARAAYHLEQLARLGREPARLGYWLPRAVALLGAALGGLGLIFWIAANWDTFGRFGRFALLQGVFLATCAGALWRPAARAPLALLALLTIGALFACFGQTYQSGADPWQLFALWAALSLPLCLSVRSDILWTPWSLVAASAISLWAQAHTGHTWRVEAADLAVQALAWGAALAQGALLSPPLRRFTGAGSWSLHVTVTLAAGLITTTALGALFGHEVAPQYWLGLAVLGGAAGALCQPRWHEVFVLSAIGLAMNMLLVAGLARFLLDNNQYGSGTLLLLGLFAAGLLAATVHLILHLTRRQQAQRRAA